MNLHPLARRLGREIARTFVALGLYLGALAFLGVVAVKFVPSLLENVAASTPFGLIDVASSQANERATNGKADDATPLHGTITERDGSRRREPHMLPN